MVVNRLTSTPEQNLRPLEERRASLAARPCLQVLVMHLDRIHPVSFSYPLPDSLPLSTLHPHST